MKKRGGSHIEMILSFIIFIAAVGAALYFFSPARTDRLVDSTLDYTFREITAETQTAYERYFVTMENMVNVGYQGKDLRLEMINVNSGQKTRTIFNRGAESAVMKSKVEGGKVVIGSPSFTLPVGGNINNWDKILGTDKFEIILADSFVENAPSGTIVACESAGGICTLAFQEKKVVYSQSDFEALKAEYDSNYNGVRERFNLPRRVQFEFEVPAIGVNAARLDKPDGVEVFQSKKRIELLKSNGEIIFTDLIVRVW